MRQGTFPHSEAMPPQRPDYGVGGSWEDTGGTIIQDDAGDIWMVS